MTKQLIFISLLSFTLAACGHKPQSARPEVSFDEGWLFFRGDVKGGEDPSFNDSGWRNTDVPHDWSIEDIPGSGSPFDSSVVNGVASGFTRGGTGWYRKYFTLPEGCEKKMVFIRFDGVYMNSDVWVNGNHAGNHFYGYSPFEYEISHWLKPGRDNVIAVRVKNDSVRCRWYSGSGIFRHVRLIFTPQLHLETPGIAVITDNISGDKASVTVKAAIVNESEQDEKATIRFKILDEQGKEVAAGQTEIVIPAGEKSSVNQIFSVTHCRLWSPDDPYLYSLETGMTVNNQLTDVQTQSFGIRSLQFDPQHGFRLNGKVMKLKGGCIHHDNGPLGAMALGRAEERKIELLKAAGFNAVRMAHNPPSSAILDACDRLGMLVIDEAFDAWTYGHFSGDYSSRFDSLWRNDLAAMILRDMNHPSIIMWSIGNEIKNADTEEIAALCGEMAGFVRSADPTRPVTAAVNSVTPAKDPYLSHLDVCGYNYCRGLYLSDHQRVPERIMYCSESYPSEAYGYWQGVIENPWVIGDFVWTAFDYIGEASIGWRGYMQDPGFFPWNLAWCGDLDICGFSRPQSFYRQTLWNDGPQAGIFVTPPLPSFPLNPSKEKWSVWDWADVTESWNFEGYENEPLTVSVYTGCEEAELFLNGVSRGKKTNLKENKNIIQWQVPYQPGELKADGYTGGKIVVSATLKTAGKPSGMTLKPDRLKLKADGQDLSYVTVEITDDSGIRNPVAENLVTFSISGAGRIAAVGNSNPVSLESFTQPRRKAWHGRCLVVVRSMKEKGIIHLVAHSEGLPDSEIDLVAE